MACESGSSALNVSRDEIAITKRGPVKSSSSCQSPCLSRTQGWMNNSPAPACNSPLGLWAIKPDSSPGINRCRIVSARPSLRSCSKMRSRSRALFTSSSPMIRPNDLACPTTVRTCFFRSTVYESSKCSPDRPRITASSFQARLLASRIPAQRPCPKKGGIWCAASPARKTRP